MDDGNLDAKYSGVHSECLDFDQEACFVIPVKMNGDCPVRYFQFSGLYQSSSAIRGIGRMVCSSSTSSSLPFHAACGPAAACAGSGRGVGFTSSGDSSGTGRCGGQICLDIKQRSVRLTYLLRVLLLLLLLLLLAIARFFQVVLKVLEILLGGLVLWIVSQSFLESVHG